MDQFRPFWSPLLFETYNKFVARIDASVSTHEELYEISTKCELKHTWARAIPSHLFLLFHPCRKLKSICFLVTFLLVEATLSLDLVGQF